MELPEDTEDSEHAVTPFIVVYFSKVFHYRLVQVDVFTLHVTLMYLYHIEHACYINHAVVYLVQKMQDNSIVQKFVDSSSFYSFLPSKNATFEFLSIMSLLQIYLLTIRC